jgi:transcriptional regulator with XRE-family HTH domain
MILYENNMNKHFGETVKNLRIKAGIGLRELARIIDKSAGYLSDVENGRVPPPSEAIILEIAKALEVDKSELLIVARKVDPELSEYVAQQPQAADFLRMAKNQEFSGNDWERLTQLAKFTKLGKGRNEEK